MRTINLKISVRDLMRETAKWGYTSAEGMEDGAAKQRHYLQGPTDPGHADLIRSAFDDAWSELMQILGAYTYTSECGCGCGCEVCEGLPLSENSDADYDCEVNDDYSVILKFPDNTQPTLPANIGRLCRRYMLMCGRAEWETVTRQSPELSLRTAEMTARRLKVEVTNRTTVGRLKKWNYGY